jgi:hypothetical protein
MKIEFDIITRGSMIVRYGDKTATIYGELIFEPPTFYAEINSIKKWDKPFDSKEISDAEKKEIIEFISSNSNTTKIIFE